MSDDRLYLDTSALAKWYIEEDGSADFEKFIRARDSACISRLTVVELRCLLSRRRRNTDISAALERAIARQFDVHVRDGILDVLPLEDQHVAEAAAMIEKLHRIPLRTLDSLHLSVARASRIDTIATADHTMARAAKALKFQVHSFG